MRTLQTAAEVVEVLGGDEAVAANLFATEERAVANWRLKGKFPAHTFIAIKLLLKRKRLDASDKLWTMTPLATKTERQAAEARQ